MEETNNDYFTSAMSLTDSGVPRVPTRYILPPSQRPMLGPSIDTDTVIDLFHLHDPLLRHRVILEIETACKEFGFFQPCEDPYHGHVKIHGLICGHRILHVTTTHVLHKQLIEAISESLGLEKNYLQEEIEEGSQVMAVNCYPSCPEPEIALGMPPHSNFSSLTILLQSSQGLQIMDSNKNWICVPYIEGALIVQLEDQVEVMRNGIYKSVVHRVTVNRDYKRLSFASLHSLPMDKKISPASKLVNENNPAASGESSFNDFLEYVSKNDITQQRFIDTIKKNNL